MTEKRPIDDNEPPVRRGRRSNAEKAAREAAERQAVTGTPEPREPSPSPGGAITFHPPASPTEDEPEWLKIRRRIRERETNGTDPVSLPDPVTVATQKPPEPGEFTGSLRERGIQKELAAAIINVNTGSLTQWIAAGNVRLTPDGFVPIPEVRRKLIEVYRHKNRITSTTVGSGEDAVDAKQRSEIAKANLAELEFAKASRLVVSRQAVKLKFADIAAVVKTRILSLPERLADELLGQTKRHIVLGILTRELTEALEGLARPFKLITEEDDGDEKDGRSGGGSGEEVSGPGGGRTGRAGQGRVPGRPGAAG